MQFTEFKDEAEGFAIRAVEVDGLEWFVAKDVCNVLAIKNSRMALARLDEDEKDVSGIDTLGGAQEVSIINESGLYALILRSNKPKAKAFRRWVTGEVLPAIRRNGAYALVQGQIAPPAPMEHPVTLFLETFDELAKRGVSATRAAYSIGCLFQSAVSAGIASTRGTLPPRYPEPPALAPQLGNGERGNPATRFQPQYSPQQILETARRLDKWKVSHLQDAVMSEHGMSRRTFYNLMDQLTTDGRLVRDGEGRLSVAKEGGVK